MSSKGTKVADIEEGGKVAGIFLVKEMSLGETRAGKPFLRLTVMDQSGEIGGPVWEDAQKLAPHCQPGSFLQIEGRGENYRGTPQLRINRLQPVPADQVEPADFMPSGDFDRQQLSEELHQLIAALEDPQLARLLRHIFNDQQLARRFTTAPAAKSMHHAYLGGLLEHTVAVARLALAVCQLYPDLDRDLLLAGALLHDLGKTEELTYEGYPFNYSNRGRLVGHLVIGAELVASRAAELEDLPSPLLERLQHLILSHHGRHEFGAPTLPMMQEAFILHFLDDLDAKVNYCQRLRRQLKEPGYQWSDYQRNLERFLYLPGHGHQAPEPEAAAPLVAEDKPPEPAPTTTDHGDEGCATTASGDEEKGGEPGRQHDPPPPEPSPRQQGLWG
ncbi:MAG: HD domain-containing protein [Desulfurivibrio sp.]|nr:HD domain-containing protein [Desulfurivibrio sp.]